MSLHDRHTTTLVLVFSFALLQARTTESLSSEQALRLASAIEQAKQYYIEPKSYEELVDSAIKGIVSSLDPYSEYLDHQSLSLVNHIIGAKHMVGIGIQMKQHPQGLEVIASFDGSPAAQAQIQSGDILTHINGVDVTKNEKLALSLLRDKENNPLTLTIYDPEEKQERTLTLTRQTLAPFNVSARMLSPSVAYLKIPFFTEKTDQEIEKFFEKTMKKQNIHGVIIDLRNNPGGLLDSATRSADLFLDSQILKKALILNTSSRTEHSRLQAHATPGDISHHAKIAVLINRGTASSAEVLAAALHDHHRAVLIGQKTFGKGSVQSILPLNQNTAIKITTARFTTPKGAPIESVGLRPDIEVIPAQHYFFLTEQDSILNRALDYLSDENP